MDGSGAARVSLIVFNRFARPDLVARYESALAVRRSFVGLGGWRSWYMDAVKDARAMLGDSEYDTLAAVGRSFPPKRLLEEIVHNLTALAR